MEYKETLRSIPDNLVADIYKKEKTNFFIIYFYFISDSGKRFIFHKVRSLLTGHSYQAMKNEIKDKLFQEAYLKAYRPSHIESSVIVVY